MSGYCYLNGTALVALVGGNMGLRIAVVDLDYHHGNGTQDLLYGRDILFCSIHGDPRVSFPYFRGFSDEVGEGPGAGHNLNVPLPGGTEWLAYRHALSHVLDRAADFGPDLRLEDDRPAVLPHPDEPVSFEKHVKTLFRHRDRQSMTFAFDLWSYEDVKQNAQPILERLHNGSMPCDGGWQKDKVDAFERWVTTGMRE